MTLHRLFIANRGEIACRIIATARRMGFTTIVPVSDVDHDSRAARLADIAYPIGGDTPASSYLNQETLLKAIKECSADAVHPGYGFLAENADFAAKVEAAGVTWVGPSAEVITWMGDKREARIRVANLGGPCVPGYDGATQDDDILLREAKDIGLPIMLKAAHGGGGRGMRRVEDWSDFNESLRAARREAKSAFGNDSLILERAIDHARHVEVQVFGNGKGEAIHLYERDCSIQRRHQKVVEEAPCVTLSEAGRADLLATAVDITAKLNYRGAGTLEFLLAPSGDFYFLEMNTRIQVEHPVSECITGLDLVEMQLRLAEGHTSLPSQSSVPLNGHAIEVRVYAEDPARGYLPSSGDVQVMHLPEVDGIRIDQAIETHDTISPFYDPMVAKVIAYGRNRPHALKILSAYLKECRIFGFQHNLPFLEALVEHPDVVNNEVYTKWLDERAIVEEPEDLPPETWVSIARSIRSDSPGRHTSSGYDLQVLKLRYNESERWVEEERLPNGEVQFYVDGKPIEADLDALHPMKQHRDGHRIDIMLPFGVRQVEDLTHSTARIQDLDNGVDIRAPLNGKVASISVGAGESVSKGDVLMIIEAMKLETPVKANREGVIASIGVTVHEQVQQGQTIGTFDPIEGTRHE